MANYVKQAAREVDSMISAGHKINAQQRNQVVSEYANYLQNLDAERVSGQNSLGQRHEVDAAKMANRLAARGLGGDGGAQFNYGRLDAEHEGNLSGLMAEFLKRKSDLLTQQGKATGTIDAQDLALSLSRDQKVGELARALEDRGRAYEMQQAQLALQRAAAARAAQEAQWQHEQWLAEHDPNAPVNERDFILALQQMGESSGWKSLAPLARYARAYGKDLNDYYKYLDAGLIDAATARRGTQYSQYLADNPLRRHSPSGAGSYGTKYGYDYLSGVDNNWMVNGRRLVSPNPFQ